MADESVRLHCPACHGELTAAAGGVACRACGVGYPVEDGIPLLFLPNEWSGERADVTSAMKQFYEATPFPNYDDIDDMAAFVERARRGLFARLLGEQIPFGSRVLECGCGTGQLTNFLSIANRTVIGSDLCLNSLKLAQAFKQRNHLDGARFVQMNLFRPAFAEASFDWVISNGVLHHTSDPRGAFKSIAALVKPGGYILVGLYHHFGRLLNDVRRVLMRLSRDRLRFIDRRLMSRSVGDKRKAAWFADQYKNPHESKHTIAEVMTWLAEAGFSFVKSIPKNRIGESIAENEDLTAVDSIGGRWERAFKEFGMTFTHAQDGGLFVVIGRRDG
jgi:SAM-dependent methyltransferase